jgi:amino acid transporter
MTTTQIRTTATATTTAPAAGRRSVWKHGVAAAVGASAATTAIAALATADGVSFATEPGGPGIPPLGFAQLTLVFALVGVVMAAVMARKARRPQRTFVRTAVALTALSVVPDLTFGFDTPSAISLIVAHTVAATIVVPTLAGRLARTR